MPSAEAPIPVTLDAAELAALFAATGGRGKTALRNRALLMVMSDAALRSAEVVALRPGDVDVAEGNVRVRCGKGRKSRQIRDCLHPDTREALTAWLAVRGTLGWDNRSAVLFGTFYTRPDGGFGARGGAKTAKGGGELNTAYLRQLTPKLAAKAGLKKKVNPHLLRHSRAREWSDQGRPPADIQHDLGHANLAITHLYLARLASAGAGAGERERGV